MIRYALDSIALEQEIRATDRTWFAKAEKRTRAIVAAGQFSEKASIWSKTKPAFIRLQMNKCVFCERQFETPDYGTIEYDVEHFRPKSSVEPWPDASRHPRIAYDFATGEASSTGYFWLAYDVLNYAASCKVCNTIFKLNYFPIASSRAPAPADATALRSERPFLCYPIGTADDDPETLITFSATTAVPAKRSGHAAKRGRLIIDFFGLNEREQLHRQRAHMITLFGPALNAMTSGNATASDRQLVAKMSSPILPHAGCLRAFRRLWGKDPGAAARVFERCRLFITSDTGTTPPGL